MPDRQTALLAAAILGARHWWKYIIDHSADFDFETFINALDGLEETHGLEESQ